MGGEQRKNWISVKLFSQSNRMTLAERKKNVVNKKCHLSFSQSKNNTFYYWKYHGGESNNSRILQFLCTAVHESISVKASFSLLFCLFLQYINCMHLQCKKRTKREIETKKERITWTVLYCTQKWSNPRRWYYRVCTRHHRSKKLKIILHLKKPWSLY